MSDQNELYEDGDVVWVKLGPCWWPGQVVGNDKLPPDILPSLRKTPIAAVKFFQEDTYEYVKSNNLIFKYNCSRKHEFIKKGLQDLRRGASHMFKFPADVSTAETLTDGDPDIINRDEFAFEPKVRLSNSFGSPKKATPRGSALNSPRDGDTDFQGNSHSATSQGHGKSGYTARILVQPSLRQRNGSTEGSTPKQGENENTDMEVKSAETITPNKSFQSGGYTCHACPFTTARLNVMILHNKSHSVGFIPYTPSPIRPKPKCPIKSSKNIDSFPKKYKPQQTIGNLQKRGTRRKVQEEISDNGIVDSKSADVSSTPRRGGAKVRDKLMKKSKSDMEIKNSLLADWSEESDESMDILTSLHLTETQCALPDESKASIIESESKYEAEESLEEMKIEKLTNQRLDIPQNLTDKNEKNSTRMGNMKDDRKLTVSDDMVPKSENGKDEECKRLDKLSSCFDFKEEEEWPEEADIGRKIPRVNLKIESDTLRKLSDVGDSHDDALKVKKDNSKDLADLDAEVKILLDKTKLPELPSVPQGLKHQENFPEAKAIKFPDKKESGDGKPPSKTIFKTKSFFRSRHSRSQDAIEKYIADNTNLNIDKSSSYIDRIVDDESTIEIDKMKHDHVATCDLFESDPAKLVHSTQKIRVTKLAPKIQLKKMKAAAQLKQNLNNKEFDTAEVVQEVKPSPQTSLHADILGTIEPLETDFCSLIDIPKKTEAVEDIQETHLTSNTPIIPAQDSHEVIAADLPVSAVTDDRMPDLDVGSKTESAKTETDVITVSSKMEKSGIPHLGDIIRDEWDDDDMKDLKDDLASNKIEACNESDSKDETVLTTIVEDPIPKNDMTASKGDDERVNYNATEDKSKIDSGVVSRSPPSTAITTLEMDVDKASGEGKSPSESDFQIAVTLINLPATTLHDVPEEEEDQNLNAAESLVQMSETLQNNHTNTLEFECNKSITDDTHASGDVHPVGKTHVAQTPCPITGSSSSELLSSTLITSNTLSLKADEDLRNAPTKLLQIFEESSPVKNKPNLKVITSSPVHQKSKEKILNFGVGMSPSKVATVQPQKQKIIIRRTGTIPLKSDVFSDELLPKPQVSKQSDEVQTFTIKQTSPNSDPSSITLQPKESKLLKSPKILTKPQSTIITSTGAIVQSSKRKADESLFDINSMPIVLSDDLVTPENIDSMPIMKSDGTVVPPKPLIQKINSHALETKGSGENLETKPEFKSKPEPKSNIIIKQMVEKTNSPNILSKSSKMRSMKPVLVLDKSTGEQKLIMTKSDPPNDGKQLTLSKLPPNILTQQSAAGKVEKYIILPGNPTSSKANMLKRQQKIILNPQTGKAHMILGNVGESVDSDRSKMMATSKVIASRPNAEATGNTVMIITNSSGMQSRIVLTSEHEKLLFPKKATQSTAVTPQTIVTSKGTLITPNHGSRGRSSLVTSQSIITSKGQILTTASLTNATISSKTQAIQQQTKLITKQKAAGIPPQGQIIMPQTGKRTILTAVPGQAILTSKGQLITSTHSTTITSQGKIITTAKLPYGNTQQMKLFKTSQRPIGKITSTAVMPQAVKAERPSAPGASGQAKTLQKFMPTSFTSGQKSKEHMIVLQQKCGNVLHMTAAQFEHLQKTGQILQKLPVSPKSVATLGKSIKSPSSKVILKTGTDSSENIIAPVYQPRKSGVSAVKHKLQASSSELVVPKKESEVVPIKKQRLRELLMKIEPAKVLPSAGPLVSETVPAVTCGDGSQGFDNLDDLIPATTIQTQKVITDSGRLKHVNTGESEPASAQADLLIAQNKVTAFPEDNAQSELFDNQNPALAQQQSTSSMGDGQLLAVPGENFGGPPDSFFLCMEENGVLTPIDNQALVLENNQLVPMRQPIIDQPAVVEPSNEDRQLTASERIGNRQASAPLNDAGQQNILINAGDQQILLDQQTLMSLLGGDGQQVVTVDGQQLVLQGNAQQILAALAESSNALAPGPVLHSTRQMLIPGTQPQLLLSGSSDEFIYEPTSHHHTANQDILAAALANTDVFQQESLIPESLNITSSAADMLMDIDSLSPNFHNLHPNLPVHGNVSETSSTLNQPIMTPLEIPTKTKDESGIATRNSGNTNALLAQNLEESLAVIGVSPPNIPTSLELPITVTNPHIAPKTTNPLNMSSPVYPNPALIGTPMILSNLNIPEPDVCRLNVISSGGSMRTKVGKSSTGKLNKVSETVEPTVLKAHATSMPSLDDSFLEEKSFERKSFSTMSMPLLTDDDVNEVPDTRILEDDSENRENKKLPKSMPMLTDLDDEPEDSADKESPQGEIPSIEVQSTVAVKESELPVSPIEQIHLQRYESEVSTSEETQQLLSNASQPLHGDQKLNADESMQVCEDAGQLSHDDRELDADHSIQANEEAEKSESHSDIFGHSSTVNEACPDENCIDSAPEGDAIDLPQEIRSPATTVHSSDMPPSSLGQRSFEEDSVQCSDLCTSAAEENSHWNSGEEQIEQSLNVESSVIELNRQLSPPPNSVLQFEHDDGVIADIDVCKTDGIINLSSDIDKSGNSSQVEEEADGKRPIRNTPESNAPETLDSPVNSILASTSPESNALIDDRSQNVETNSIPDRISDELNVETSSTSTHNEYPNPELLTPDTIPPTPPEPPGDNSHHLSETSSDSSEVIPLQPTISVSQRAVQSFSNEHNVNIMSCGVSSEDGSVSTERKRASSEGDSSQEDSRPMLKKTKYDDEAG